MRKKMNSYYNVLPTVFSLSLAPPFPLPNMSLFLLGVGAEVGSLMQEISPKDAML